LLFNKLALALTSANSSTNIERTKPCRPKSEAAKNQKATFLGVALSSYMFQKRVTLNGEIPTSTVLPVTRFIYFSIVPIVGSFSAQAG
jgi:hypothetical protein